MPLHIEKLAYLFHCYAREHGTSAIQASVDLLIGVHHVSHEDITVALEGVTTQEIECFIEYAKKDWPKPMRVKFENSDTLQNLYTNYTEIF